MISLVFIENHISIPGYATGDTLLSMITRERCFYLTPTFNKYPLSIYYIRQFSLYVKFKLPGTDSVKQFDIM